MPGQDMLLFLVYNLLKEKFDKEADNGFIPDHLKDDKREQSNVKEQIKTDYINSFLSQLQDKNSPKPLPLSPVQPER